jgi:ABC-type multidrug transport system fused ATPase/permease subunit
LIIMASVELENAMQSCERIRELRDSMQLEPEGGRELVASNGDIEFDHVSVVYRKGLPNALTDVSFKVAAGSKVGVCGRTGSGKSTLVRVLLRLLEYEGVVRVDGQDIAPLNLIHLRTMLPTVTQASLMLRGTVRDAIDPVKRLKDDEVRQLMERMGIGHVALDVAATSLSSGELQLASFCRALAAVEHFGARCLLLDEASSSIDTISERFMADVLQHVLKDVTVVVIAHRIASIMACDSIIVLGDGRLLESGSPAELNRPGTHFYDLVNNEKQKGEKGKQREPSFV